jgi:Ino eighty subunit 1
MQRTYHSMPAIQLDEFSRKNIPDAPRMKAQLKSCVLSQEVPTGPTEGLRSISLRSVRLARAVT